MPTSDPSLWTVLAPYVAATVAIAAAILAAWSTRQSARVSHTAKISEFREKWLNELRRDIADYVGAAAVVYRKWEEINDLPSDEKGRREREELFPVANAARVILWRVRLRINPRENKNKLEDDAFLTSLLDLMDPGKVDPQNPEWFWHQRADASVEHGREILKREWEVAKQFPRVR